MSNSIKRRSSKSIGAAATVVGTGSTQGAYTAPSVTSGVFVTGLTLCNTTGSAITAQCYITDGTLNFNLCVNTPIPSGGSLSLADEGHRCALNAGDQVVIASSAASSIDVNMSVLEIT